jgi:hypothetical protein
LTYEEFGEDSASLLPQLPGEHYMEADYIALSRSQRA